MTEEEKAAGVNFLRKVEGKTAQVWRIPAHFDPMNILEKAGLTSRHPHTRTTPNSHGPSPAEIRL
jgi:hypothetical protein